MQSDPGNAKHTGSLCWGFQKSEGLIVDPKKLGSYQNDTNTDPANVWKNSHVCLRDGRVFLVGMQ